MITLKSIPKSYSPSWYDCKVDSTRIVGPIQKNFDSDNLRLIIVWMLKKKTNISYTWLYHLNAAAILQNFQPPWWILFEEELYSNYLSIWKEEKLSIIIKQKFPCRLWVICFTTLYEQHQLLQFLHNLKLNWPIINNYYYFFHQHGFT